MPKYEYACKSCEEHIEVVQSFTEDSLTECPSCGGPLRKVFGNIGVVLKGSGFYKTDNRTSSPSSRAASEAASKAESKGSEKSESKNDSSSGQSSGDKPSGDKRSGDKKSGDTKSASSPSSNGSDSASKPKVDTAAKTA